MSTDNIDKRKEKFLSFYSEFLDIQHEQFGKIKQFPSNIWKFSSDYSPINNFNISIFEEQRETNSRISWREMGNLTMSTYKYLSSAYSWFELLKRYIDHQGLNQPEQEYLKDHLLLEAKQDQLEIIYMLMPELNSAIIGLVSIEDRVANILVRTFNNIFIDYNKKFFLDNNPIQKQFKNKIESGNVAKIIIEANTVKPVFTNLIKLLEFFRSEDWLRIQAYRHEIIHSFGQSVGGPTQGIQIINEKINKQGKTIEQNMACGIIKLQKWTHEELVLLTVKLWNGAIDQIELIFKELTENISKEAFQENILPKDKKISIKENR